MNVGSSIPGWPELFEGYAPTEQHPGSREFSDDDERAPPHFNDETNYEAEEDE